MWSYQKTHLWFLHKILPAIFTYDFTLKHSLHPALNQFLFLGISYVLGIFYIIGLRQHSKVKRCETAFEKVGIKNSVGQYPKVVEYKELSPFRSKVRLLVDGIGINEFTNATPALESSLKNLIEDIQRGREPQFIELYLTKKRLSKMVPYEEVCSILTTPYTFIVGESLGELITQDITSLPHALVAGSTGTGKSAFLKQMVMGLLEGSSCLQIYLVDLKNGLEMKDFAICPNVEMVKTISDALGILKQVNSEMERRFKVLEASGFNRIDPKRDKLDRIIVLIDEASVLYTTSRANASEKKLAQLASEVTDNIAKLSRAAGINLVLSTQKVVKETLSTLILENLEGRMAFEVNSIQGSSMVLGTADAKHLPHIPGRGIWKVGSRMTEVQTPYIKDSDIKNRCEVISDEFKSGKRKLFMPMFSGEVATEEENSSVAEMNETTGPKTS